MKIAVTGASGRLGSAVCHELAKAGHDVVATDAVASRDPGVPVHIVDLRDGDAVGAVIAGAEAVVHLGNHVSYVDLPASASYLENVAMNFNVARAAIDSGVRRLIFASSIQVCSGESEMDEPKFPGRPSYIPGDGELPAIPRNPYALSKEAGEHLLRYLCRTHGITGVAIRFPLLLEKIDELGRPFHFPNEFFAWLSYRDGARLVAAILAKELSGFRIYLPASPRSLNGRSATENVRDFFQGVPLRFPQEEIAALVDTSAITGETGWKPE